MVSTVFYFDRCFGKRFPEVLDRMRPPFVVEYQHNSKNRFPQDLPDDVWLEMCGKRKWIAFSHDSKFQKIDVEALAIKQHKVGVFAIGGAQLPTWDKLCNFVRGYPKIVRIIKNEKPPYLYRLTLKAELKRVPLP